MFESQRDVLESYREQIKAISIDVEIKMQNQVIQNKGDRGSVVVLDSMINDLGESLAKMKEYLATC